MAGRKETPFVVVAPAQRRLGTFVVGAFVAVALVAVGTGKIGDLLPSIPNPFGSETVDRSQPPLLQSLVDLSEYHAASANFQVIVDSEKDARFLPSFIRGQRTVYVAGGSVDASVDFARLGEQSVVSEDRRSVTITLPSPALSVPRIDPGQSRVVSRDRGVLDRIGSAFSDNPTSEQPLMLAAEEKMRDAAGMSDLRAKAEGNTRHMLEAMMGSLGYTDVTVNFAPNPA